MTPGYENSLAMSTSGMPNQYQEAESIRHQFENQRQHQIGHFQPHIHVNVTHTQQPTSNQQTLVNSGQQQQQQQQQQIDENMYYINHQQQQQPLNNRTSIFLPTQSAYQPQPNESQSNLSNLSAMINSVETKSGVIESSETKPNRNEENNEKQELKSSGEVVEYNDETVDEKDQIVETESYRDMSLLAAKNETEDKELESKNIIDKDEANISQTSPKDSAKNEQQEQPTEKTNISYSNPENDSSSSSQDDNLENKVEGLTILKKSKLNEAVLSDVNSNRKESMLKVEQKVQENVSGGNDLVKS